ncbi:GAF domain-containing protein [Chitinophagaceae bacterium LB-8]|uniref:histidine kinase n=1 Tax=Paraflavisolibacter caeni TaxID=2982496 RepID=A0A9X3B7R2_9BACT|nr:GAF domain-containing protein [Paraflavisolibacter caeni]MCU7549605.1 GAF domain-containing protein [Paraflavisolibacter caeni]
MKNNYCLPFGRCLLFYWKIFIVFFLLIPFISVGQNNAEDGLPFITNFSAKEYKGSPQNWAIIQDNRGVMYVANSFGLLEYDGVKWRNIRSSANDNGVVRSLTKDKNGRIYYGSYNDMGYLKPDSLGQLQFHSLFNFIPAPYKNFNDIWTIHVADNGIYFQAREWIFRLQPVISGDKENWKVKVWKPDTKFMFAFNLDGTYYVHQQNKGLMKMVADSLMLIPGSEVLGNERMQVMLPFPSSSGKKYLLGQFYGGLYVYDGKNFQPFTSEADPLIKSGTLYKGTLLKDGRFALAIAGKGLVILDAKGKMQQLINRDVGLQDESVYAVYTDQKGVLWVGLDNGISRIETASPLTQFTTQSGIKTAVLSIKRHDGDLYLGTSNGLMRMNKTVARFELINEIPSNQIFELVPDNNTLLVSSDGLFYIQDRKAHLIKASKGGDLQITALKIFDKYPNVLFAGVQGALVAFYRNGIGSDWKFAGHIPGITDYIWSIIKTRDDRLWAGTQGNGVIRISNLFDKTGNLTLQNAKVEQFGPSQGLSPGGCAVFSIQGKEYFVSNSGVSRYDENRKRFIPDNSFGPMGYGHDPNEYAMVPDNKGRIWICFGKEVALATLKADGKYRMEKTPFLPFADRVISEIYPEDDGTVWFASTDGLIRYDEKIQKDYREQYKTLVRNVMAGQQTLDISSNTNEKGQQPSLNYKNNTFRFEYAAPYFQQEQKTQYQTWLEGFENTWSDWGSNNYKEYTNLSEGRYKFHVRARNVYQQISEEAVYSFNIQPPWFRTPLAYALYALVLGSLIFGIVRYRTHQLHEKHRELEKTVSERTAELRQRIEELAVINSVQEGLVAQMDIQTIYELVGNRIHDLFDVQVIAIAVFDHETGMELFKYVIEKGVRYYPEQRPLDKLRQHLIQTRQKILINKNTEEAFTKFGMNVLPGTEFPKSMLFVPLTVGDKITSYVSLQNIDREEAFSESDVRLLETLANSMSVALESARLFDETKMLLAETETAKKNVELLGEIGKEITASLDFETIFYKLYENINQLTDATIFGIGIYSREEQRIDYKFAIEKGKRYEPYSRDTTDKNQFPVWCIENRQPVLINDVALEYSRYINHYKEKNLYLEDGSLAEDPLSFIYLPLIVQDRVLGIITIQSFKKNAYSEYHLNLLQNLATYTGIALDNASAYRKLNEREQEIAARAAELSTVNSISQALASKLELDSLIQLVGDQMQQLFKADIAYLALLDQKTGMISFPYQYGEKLQPLQLGEGLTSQIILTGKPLLINKDVSELTAELGISRVGIPAASYLGVPVPVGDEIIGVLSVQSTQQENWFNEKDQRLLNTIAAHVGVALRKARLFEEVKQANLEAEAARKIAVQANEAKSAFLSTVSHELRTPLTSVLGFARIIKKRLDEKIFPFTDVSDPKTEKAKQQVCDNLEVVIAEGERLTHLINDVLDLAKIEAGKMEWNTETIAMEEIVERAIAATSALFINKNITLEKEVVKDLPMVIGDRDKLIQVVVNLISNAVKFTHEGAVRCSVAQKDDEIIVSISDTGIGIAKEDYKSVFEKFKQVGDTLTDKPKGTGLGLPICKEIVEHHGGQIWLESELGKGSTFIFSIPSISEKEPVLKPIQLDKLMKQLKDEMKKSKLNNKERTATILVVDDDTSIRSLLQQELGELGYRIEEATNGKEALESIRKHRPDLIILDVMMPEMNGFDLAAILKNDPQTLDIPIIMLSIVQDKARGYRVGVDRYLTKPIDTTQLFAEVGNLLEQGKSKKKVMVVDEDNSTVRSLSEVLQTKGYQVVESDGKELVEKAITNQPDIIILNSLLNGRQEIVQTLRFEKGLENVVFVLYQ